MHKNEVVAVIAAHPDDEVLGCGGTISRLTLIGAAVHVLILTDGVTSRWDEGQSADSSELMVRRQAAYKANEIIGTTSLEIDNFPDNRMDSVDLLNVVKRIEDFIKKYQPTLVLTHHAGDVNIDHRVVHDAVIAACRSQPSFCVKDLMFFEIASSTEWRPANSGLSFMPSVFIDISSTLEKKLAALLAYSAELRKFPHPRSIDAVEALARWRGATAGVAAAESFIQGRRII